MRGSLRSLSYGLPLLLVLAAMLLGAARSQDQVILPPPIYPHSTCTEIVSWLQPGAADVMVLQVVSDNFARLQTNFVVAMTQNSRLTTDNMFVLCLGEAARKAMESISVHGVQVEHVHNSKDIWRLRVHVLTCLVGHGLDVIMSDSDVVWLADPIPYMNEIDADIYASRAPWPPEYADPLYGNTACMGFIMFRARVDGINNFLEIAEKLVQEIGDDQIGMNKVIWQSGVLYDYDEARSDMRLYNSTGVGKAVLTDAPGNLRLALLPHSKFTRHCEITAISNETIVAHCHPPTQHGGGKPSQKESQLKDWGLWVLD